MGKLEKYFQIYRFYSGIRSIMKNFTKQFPLLEQYTYLNTAASGLLPEEVLEFRQDHDLDLLVSGSILREQQGKLLAKVRESVGGLFNCAPNQVALTPNFSYGFNTLMEGVSTLKKVLLLENDYPSINWAVESRGFEVCHARIDEYLESNISAAMAEHKPDILAFSLVQYINGIKIDLEFLSRLKLDYPDLLIFADGTQFCGTEAFDFETSGIDVLGASGYKWMNAGYGNAFFFFKESVAGKVAPKSLGFNSLQGKYKPQEGNFIGRFEPGHQDTLNFGSLTAAVQLIRKIGMDSIEAKVKSLAMEAKLAFEKEELLEPSVILRGLHSSIFNIKGNEALFQHLNQHNIICSQRGEGIRISFHYFNTSNDLDKLMEVLKKWKKKR